MKRYLLFTWVDYEAQGGFNDFAGDFDELEDAKSNAIVSRTWGWADIIDTHTWVSHSLTKAPDDTYTWECSPIPTRPTQ